MNKNELEYMKEFFKYLYKFYGNVIYLNDELYRLALAYYKLGNDQIEFFKAFEDPVFDEDHILVVDDGDPGVSGIFSIKNKDFYKKYKKLENFK